MTGGRYARRMALVMPADEFGAVKRAAAALAVRHDGHDPALPCRPALGASLCYPAAAGVQLVPWREALENPQQGGEPG